MTTYFITGGFGFLGQYIVQAIHDHDPSAKIRVLGRTARKTYLGVEKLENVRWVQGDLSKLESFESELKDTDIVIHNAAMVSFSKSDADAVYQANVVGTHNLAQASVNAGIKNFIFISSISSVGRNPNRLIDENDYPDLETKRQKDMYGYSKMLNEAELVKLKDKMRIIMLNPSVILGPGSPRIESALRTIKKLPILPMLSYINSFVDVRDVAQAVIESLTKGGSGERYLVTAHNVDMIEFTKTLIKVMGIKKHVIQISDFWMRIADSVIRLMQKLNLKTGIRPLSEMAEDKAFSWTKIEEEVGWQPKYGLEESLKDSLD